MAIEHPGEPRSNEARRQISEGEPVGLRTFTPTQLAISRSAGVFQGRSPRARPTNVATRPIHS
jgi:hypothetical protein